MKVNDVICTIDARDIVRVGRGAIHIGTDGDDITVFFPDRTAPDALQLIAKTINDALAAAREVEGAARD